MTPTRYPLQWPPGWKRTPSHARKDANFKRYDKRLSIFDGVQRVLLELGRLGVNEADVVISTNVETRLDGLPRSDRPAPQDTGVCVFWKKRGEDMKCMPIDQYDKVADNLAAVAATLAYMRGIERHGGAPVLARAFSAFTALPPPIVAGMKRHWREVFNYGDGPVTEVAIKTIYRSLAGDLHPDLGGDATKMAELNVARDEALKEIS